MNFLNIIIYSLLVGISWGVTYYFVRRLPNPDLKLLNEHGRLKQDLETQKKIREFYYDAIYGGLATTVSYLILRTFRESTDLSF